MGVAGDAGRQASHTNGSTIREAKLAPSSIKIPLPAGNIIYCVANSGDSRNSARNAKLNHYAKGFDKHGPEGGGIFFWRPEAPIKLISNL
jgi:hypothetical protein